MIATREDGDSINHISLAFEIGAKIKTKKKKTKKKKTAN